MKMILHGGSGTVAQGDVEPVKITTTRILTFQAHAKSLGEAYAGLR